MVKQPKCQYCRRELTAIAVGTTLATAGTGAFRKPQPAVVCAYCDKIEPRE